MNMMEKLREKAARNPQRIAFPEAAEEKILLAAVDSKALGVAVPVFVGNPDEIKSAAKALNIDIGGIEILDHSDEKLRAETVALCLQKGGMLSEKALLRKARDPMLFAFELELAGKVDGVFAGISHATAEVILGAQTIIGLKEGVSCISSIGIADIPGYEGGCGGLLAFGDSAVCVDPSAADLADIAISACDTMKELLDWEPRCALISFSTDGSNSHELADKVIMARELANAKRPDLMIDGEFQFDSATIPKVAAKKIKRESEVAGRANIVIWPDLNTGNTAVKLIQQFGRADAYGPMLQGFALPVSDCSRGAPVSELVGNIIMLSVRAAAMKK